jgi:hypothetical protein
MQNRLSQGLREIEERTVATFESGTSWRITAPFKPGIICIEKFRCSTAARCPGDLGEWPAAVVELKALSQSR